MMNFKVVAVAVIFFGSLTSLALEGGPFVYSGKVTASNEKTVTLEIGEQKADIPVKFVPANKLKDGKIAAGSKLTVSVTEEQSKQIKVYKK